MMRRLIVALLVAAAFWAGYWFIGQRAVQSAFAAWFADQRAAGLLADYSDLRTIGFPSRFDTTITDIRLGNPATGFNWSAPFVQILALSYRPNHVIAVWPNQQNLTLPDQTIGVTSEKMQASVTVQPSPSLALKHSEMVASKVNLTSTLGWDLSLDSLRFATRPTLAKPDSSDIGLVLLGLRLPDAVLAALTADAAVTPFIGEVRIDASLGLDGPLALRAPSGTLPSITGVSVNSVDATWGQMGLHADGNLTVDAKGFLTGQVEVEARNWHQIYALIGASGVMASGLVMPIERVLESMATVSGDKNTITAPLVFSNGFVSFGQIPLGRVPRVGPQT